jgi:CheY-like chemotaxis protein
VSNACKFTDSGSVTLRAFVQNDHLLVSVADTGIGIAPDKLDHVFEEFTQVDASTTRKAGGTGLGLPISRFFVEMHRGRIWVESSMGRGSTFNFIIPIKAHPQNQAEAETTPAGIGVPNIKTVIAIDPDAGVINLYRRFLEKHAYKIAHLPHDPNLVSRVKELLPAAILLETLVPNQDGWQILKDLKQDSLTRDIPVIICSINADKNKAVSQGAADHLTKPIVESDLIATLNHVLTVQNEHTRVLVIDDHADDILLIRRILEAHNYLVSEASSGRAGVELARSRPPNLILLDLTMPGMDGFAVVQALKSHAATQHIPIIVVSAKELSPHESSRLEGHVAVLLHKGAFTETKLLEVVRKSLHQGEE